MSRRRPVPRIAVLVAAALLTLACGKDSATAPAAAAPARPAPAVDAATQATIDGLAEAVRKDPADLQARHALAIALHQAGRREEALAHFEEIAKLDASTTHLIELGVAYASVGRLDDAEAALNRALEPSPGNPVVLHHLGNLARRRGALAEAISLYRQAVERDPSYTMAQYNLADAQLAAGQVEDAYRSYEQVVNSKPKSPPELQAFDVSLLQLATIDLKMGATERAIGFLRVLIDAVPEHPQAHALLGQALKQLGREEEAQRELALHEQIAARRGTPGAPQAPSDGSAAPPPR